jgi:hypothetical protein
MTCTTTGKITQECTGKLIVHTLSLNIAILRPKKQ